MKPQKKQHRHKYIIIRLFILSFFFIFSSQCSEYFGRKPERVDLELVELLLQYSTQSRSTGCGRFSLPPIRGGPDVTNIATNGTRQGFALARCSSDSDLISMGFIPNQITYTGNGIQGNTTSSRLASQIDFVTLGGRKDQVVEVTFRLDSPEGYLDVITNASVGANATANGPGFRITPERIFAFGTTVGPTGFPIGQTPSSPVGQTRTYCLEVHDEGVAHLFGWSKPCGDLSQGDRQNYEFDHRNLQSAHPGNRVGFVLNQATLFTIAIGERIGLSGQMR